MTDLRLFNKYFCLLEFVTLDAESIQFRESQLSCCVLYLLVLEFSEIITTSFIVNELPLKIQYLIKFCDYNILFDEYITMSYKFDLNDLLPVIEFVCRYFRIRGDYINKLQTNRCFKSTEDYLQTQTLNKDLIQSYDDLQVFKQSNDC